ncbi:MAG: hypothetical protein IJG65_05005 [Synergistaceae bacterium]|nr:hypothetical protein [Synergistaceae bacterium]
MLVLVAVADFLCGERCCDVGEKTPLVVAGLVDVGDEWLVASCDFAEGGSDFCAQVMFEPDKVQKALYFGF